MRRGSPTVRPAARSGDPLAVRHHPHAVDGRGVKPGGGVEHIEERADDALVTAEGVPTRRRRRPRPPRPRSRTPRSARPRSPPPAGRRRARRRPPEAFCGRLARMVAASTPSSTAAPARPALPRPPRRRRRGLPQRARHDGRRGDRRRALPHAPSEAASRATPRVSCSGNCAAPFDVGRGGPGGWVFLPSPSSTSVASPTSSSPDLAGWRRERVPEDFLDDDAPAITLAPDWICEVLSEGTEAKDRGKKRRIYRREGVASLLARRPARPDARGLPPRRRQVAGGRHPRGRRRRPRRALRRDRARPRPPLEAVARVPCDPLGLKRTLRSGRTTRKADEGEKEAKGAHRE
jgi:hypothetical protein